MYYEPSIDKRTVTIPDVIEFVDENNTNIINVTNGIRTVTVPSQITLTAGNGIAIIETTPNNFAIQSQSGGGVFFGGGCGGGAHVDAREDMHSRFISFAGGAAGAGGADARDLWWARRLPPGTPPSPPCSKDVCI